MYNWEGIGFSAGPKDWGKFEKNNETIALNILYASPKTKEISVAYKSKYNPKRKNQENLLMITDGNKWHYLAVSNLSALLARKSSNHKRDLYCLECFNSYTTENRLKEHEEICNKHDSCLIVMLKWTERIIKYGHGEKPLRALFAIYRDLECLLKKEPRQNKPEKSYTDKKAAHEPSGWVMFTKCSSDKAENKPVITDEGIVLKNCVKS